MFAHIKWRARVAALVVALCGVAPFAIAQAHDGVDHRHSEKPQDHGAAHGQPSHDHSKMQGASPAQPAVRPPNEGTKLPAGTSKKKVSLRSNSVHSSRGHVGKSQAATTPAGRARGDRSRSGESHSDIGHADHGEGHSAMKGFLGPYAMSREGSGTSWVPDTTPHEGFHQRFGDWSLMTHGYLNVVHDNQGGPRGSSKTFAPGMLMTMAQRPVGDGTFGLRAMVSPDPFMGASGYPLLLATGETADGKTELIDRQHPHDLFMELAAIYSHPVSANASVFVYGGLPGEPALGPPAFMHRTSGVDNPEAPISHHWLDSTHITFGVVTAGVVIDRWKIEASSFRGREPDQHRYDIERPSLDSFSTRLSWNPVRELAMQLSWGRLRAPEQLHPRDDETRLTASAIYTTPFGDGNLWSTTLAWARKSVTGEPSRDAFLVESSAILKQNVTLFMRAERVAQSELAHDIPGLDGRVFHVAKASVGGIYDFARTERVKFGIGGLVSRYAIPRDLEMLYGKNLTSFMAFGRLKII